MTQYDSAKWHAVQPVLMASRSLWFFNMLVLVGSGKIDDPKFLKGKE